MNLKNLLFLAALAISSFAQARTIWQTEQGPVMGSKKNQTLHFANVPYAQPPVGSLRWKAPRPPKMRTQIWNGSQLDIRCAQNANFFSGISEASELGKPVGSEDCLYLNMWMPERLAPQRPVFVWFYGGSNRYGYAGDELYDGAELAKSMDAIVIAVNYRLAFFGAFYQSALKSENLLDSSGNFVTLDGIQALRWIRENIQQVGGDISRVTIAGESAGCINVWALVQSPLAKNLFSQGYCSSGIPNSYPPFVAENESDRFLKEALVLKSRAKDTVEATQLIARMKSQDIKKFLYSLSTEDVLSISPSPVPVQHIADGTVLPREGLAAFGTGRFNRVPMMVSTNFSEASYFVLPLFLQVSMQDMWQMVTGKKEPVALNQFINSNKYAPFLLASESLTQSMNVSVDTALLPLPVFDSPVYRFRWNWSAQNEPWKSAFGASHGIDLPFLFQKMNFSNRHYLHFLNPSLQDRSALKLSQTFHLYLKGFLHYGDPNFYKPAPRWNTWSGVSPQSLVFSQDGAAH